MAGESVGVDGHVYPLDCADGFLGVYKSELLQLL